MSAPVPTVGTSAARYVADIFSAPVTSTTNNTDIAGTTNVAVAAGDTVFFEAAMRGGTTNPGQAVTSISGLPGDVSTEILSADRVGNTAVSLIRVYFPTGMSSGTALTFTWSSAGTRKVLAGQVWTGVANLSAEASQTATASNSSPTTGTTGATTTGKGVHVAAWCWNSTVGTNSGTPNADAESTMTERVDQVVGSSSFAYLYVEDNTVTTAHAGGETATVTVSGTISSWAGVQGVWDGVTVGAQTVSPPAATASASAPAPDLPVKAPTASASASAPVPTMPIKVAGNTIILGYSNQSFVNEDIPTLERGMGRKFSGLRQNQQITVTAWTFANTDFDSGHRPATYRSIQLSTGLYTDITSGVWDTNLTSIATNLIASGRWSPSNPAIITFMHEVALSSNDFLGSAQDFINAFRYIRDLFDTLGATVRSKDGRYLGGPAIFSYVGWNRMFTNGAVDSPVAGKSYADYDPDQGSSPAPAGTTYYTLVGSDPYNQLVSGSLKYGTDAATLLDDIKAQAIARGKDWMIGEMGCADGPTTQNHLDKAAWLDSVRTYLSAIKPTDPSGVCRYLFSTQEDGGLYNWDSSPDALAAGSRLALDPYFVQNSATTFGYPPGVDVKVSPPVATAAASAPVPVLQLRVSPPAAAASASAPAPAAPAIAAPVARANAVSPTMLGKKGMRIDATLSLATMQSRLDALKLDGVEHVRATAAWPTIETADETFSWTTTDRVFTQASNRGMSVSFTVDGMPGWLNGNGYWTPPRSAGELAQWTAFATTMAARYAGQGEDGSGPVYECWNEPDQGAFWQAQGGGSAPDPAEYATVLQAFYTGIKAGDPNARVAGMVVNRTRLGFIGAVYDALESQFGTATCRANNYYFDLLALHPYCLTHPPDYPTADDTTDTWGVVARRFLDFRRAYDLVYQREGVRKNLIFGEFGYSTTTGTNGPITDATRATYVPLAYSGVRSGNYVHSLTWYTYSDASNSDFDIQGTTSETAYAAVVRSQDQVVATVPPPAATASASAPVPTVTGSTANQTVSPPAATASASSPTPVPQLRLSPAAATASASAPTPVPQLSVLPPAATAAASAPTLTLAVSVAVPAAAVTASSPTPVPQLRVLPPATTASASGLVPTVSTAPVVSPPVATVAATSPTPTIQLVVSSPLASAAASSPTPVLQLRVSPAAASATALALIPTGQLRILPGVASASASAPLPVGQLRVVAVPAVVSASAPIPTVTSIVLPPPTTTAVHGYVTVGARGRVPQVVGGAMATSTVGFSGRVAGGGAKGIVRV